VIKFFRDWIERFVAVPGIDRAMAVAAQSYSAFLPLLIVYASTLPRSDNKNFADVICTRFELTGAAAAQFGVIGIGFAMLTWFVAVAVVVVVATTGGATIADRWIRA
jgi:uncharacterized membrane protein YcfT